jgi:transcriptional regulator with XRE-family HTH domain
MDMKWDQEVFVGNVMRLLNGRHQNDLNKIVGRDSVTTWKGGDKPSLDTLLKVTEFFECSVDELISKPKKEFLSIDLELHRKIQFILNSNTEWLGSHLIQNVDSLYKGAKDMERFFEKLSAIEAKFPGGTENGVELPQPKKTHRKKVAL